MKARVSTAMFIVLIAGCGAGGHSTLPQTTASTSVAATSQRTVSSAAEFTQLLASRHLTDLGETASTESMHVVVTLAHRDEAGLRKLINDQQTPGSASYRHYLTPKSFDAQFGATSATRDLVKSNLQRGGFALTPDRFGASVIEGDIPIGRASIYFGTKFHNVTDSADGKNARIPISAPSIPPGLETNVLAFVGLDTTRAPHMRRPTNQAAPGTPSIIVACDPTIDFCPDCPDGTIGIYPNCRPAPTPPPAPTPVPGSQFPIVGPNQPIAPPPGYADDTSFSNSLGYAPYTYAFDYDMPVQHGFAGSSSFSVAVIMDSDVSDSDLSGFNAAMGVNRTGSLFRSGQGGTSFDGANEATLDVETISALAPSTDVYLFKIQDLSTPSIVQGMLSVVSSNIVAVASMSIQACEKQGFFSPFGDANAMDSIAAQGSAQGITFVASSGDWGGPAYLHPSCPSISAPAASSFVVAVGGTSPYAANATPANGFGSGPPAFAYRSDPNGQGWQFAWGQQTQDFGAPCSDNGFCGSGGGASIHFQTTEQLGACGGPWRCVPDVSFAADTFYRGAMVFQGRFIPGGGANGTSFSAPIFAALQAEIDQRQGTRKGNVVPSLYRVFQQYGYSPFAPGQPAVFHDIFQGNNGYATNAGYDWASGIGSVDGWALSAVE